MLLSIYYIQVCTYVVFLISHLVLLCESKGGGRDMRGMMAKEMMAKKEKKEKKKKSGKNERMNESTSGEIE